MNLLISHFIGSKKISNKTHSEEPKVETVPEFFIWNKGQSGNINEFFSYKEFECHCRYPECKEQRISSNLINRLTTIRKETGQPLIITSAYRCSRHQESLRKMNVATVVAQKTSQHELGKAADIVPKDRKNVRTKFLDIVSKQFKTIGLSDRFLHVDLRDDKERRWEY